MRRLLTTCAAALMLATMANASHAQSFNCGYAKKPSEVAICQSLNLSMMDESMASKYFYIVNQLPPKESKMMRSEQAAWLRSRDACGYDAGCLMSSYTGRIVELCQWMGYFGWPAACYAN